MVIGGKLAIKAAPPPTWPRPASYGGIKTVLKREQLPGPRAPGRARHGHGAEGVGGTRRRSKFPREGPVCAFPRGGPAARGPWYVHITYITPCALQHVDCQHVDLTTGHY